MVIQKAQMNVQDVEADVQVNIHSAISDLVLKTLFNIVEDRLKKWLNFDVFVV